jgi:hypothetical protein
MISGGRSDDFGDVRVTGVMATVGGGNRASRVWVSSWTPCRRDQPRVLIAKTTAEPRRKFPTYQRGSDIGPRNSDETPTIGNMSPPTSLPTQEISGEWTEACALQHKLGKVRYLT